ncbi:hypothetical protein APHAL10511_008140 [Amanita phalloides]|nr:hypothetical protein APHAL10511_008140 [Amanita phalloides]
MSNSFGESVSPVAAIQAILHDYPFSASIFRELEQNSDDARAKEQIFVLDMGKHPALMAYNDSEFHEDDWKAIQSIHQSSKKADTSKIGKYGVGFRACYHITDKPQILSGSSFAVLDPLNSGGEKMTFDEFKETEYCPHFNFFSDKFDSASFHGTVIRLPLRSSPSDLSQRTVHVGELDQMIKDYIAEEFHLSLLFLDNLKMIEIWKADGAADKALLATWSKSGQTAVRQNGDSSLFIYDSVLSNGDGIQHPWRIVQTQNSEDEAQSRLLAKAGGESVKHVIQKHKLRSDVRIAYPLSCDGYTSGRLFTFLPLPSKTNFPVHIHALFALTSSRQSLRNCNETGIVPGSDNDVLIKWNHLLFDDYIPQAWTCLLKTLAEDSDAVCKDIFTAWPPYCSSITSGDGLYWQNILPATFRMAVKSRIAIWPKVSVDGATTCVDLNSALVVARDKVDRDVLVALAQLGLTVVPLPQEHMTLLDDSTITKLVPSTARERLVAQGLACTLFDSLSPDQRSFLCRYFLSNNDVRDVYDLPLFPILDGSYISLNDRASAARRYVALTCDEVGVFRASAGDAIALAQLHPDVAEWIQKKAGTDQMNVDLLTPPTVIAYLSTKTSEEQRSDEGYLANVWSWLSTWPGRDKTMGLLRESSVLRLVPTSKGAQLVSSYIFRAPSDLRPLFEKLGLAFLSSALSPSVVQFLSHHGVLKDTCDVAHVLDAVDGDALPPLTDEEAKHVFDHVAGCYRSLSAHHLEKLKTLPVFPILDPRADALDLINTSVRWGRIDRLIVKGISPMRLIPVQALKIFHVCYLDQSSMSDPSCSLLKVLDILILRDEDMLWSVLSHFSSQPKSLQASFVSYIRKYHKSTHNVKSNLKITKFVLSSAGILQAPQDLIDPGSKLGDVFTTDSASRRVPKTEDEHDRSIMDGLRDLEILAVTLTPDMVREGISYISSTYASPQASSIARALLSMMNDPSYLCSGVLIDTSMRWLPTHLGLVCSKECIDSGRRDTDLFDQVLTPLDATISISPSFRALLNWDKPLPFDVLTKQLDRVLDLPALNSRYHKVCEVIRELANRSLLDTDIGVIQQVVGERPWIPTKSETLVPQSRAVFASVPDSSFFYEIGFSRAADKQIHQFLTRMGCRERPTASAITHELNTLNDDRGMDNINKIQQAVQLLTMLPDSVAERERGSLLIPTDTGDLVPLSSGVCYYKGTIEGDDRSVPIAHHLVNEELAQKLKMQRLGLDEAEDEIDLGEKPITTIRNTLRQYDPKQFFTEFIANASDAKAKSFSMLVDHHEGPTKKLLSEGLAAFQGPSLVVFNDGIFSRDDFRGILHTGIGGKKGKRGMIGRFGLGALTMFHFTELAMIVSGDSVLFMSPAKRNLSFCGKHSLRIPLETVKRFYPDHLKPLDGMYDFSLDSTESYKGTLFRLPLRKQSHANYDSVSSRTWDAIQIEHMLLQEFDGLAYKSLLFTELGQIDVRRRSPNVEIVRRIECTRSADNPTADAIRFETVSFKPDRLHLPSWLIISTAVDVPDKFSKELAEKFDMRHLLPVRIAVALDPAQVANFEYNLFCSLPLPIAMRLPAHISAPLILEQERRNVRIGRLGIESEYNKWLFSSEIPHLYLCLLEKLGALQMQQTNDPWWPGMPTLSSDANVPSQMIMDAFWSPETLKKSPRRVFASKYEPRTFLSLKDSVLFAKEQLALSGYSKTLSKLFSLTKPSDVVELPLALLERAEKADLRFVDGTFVRKLLEAIHEPRCLDMMDIKTLLSFMLNHKVPLDGLSLLPLEDGSYTKLCSEYTKVHYVAGPGQDALYTLFPRDRLVDSNFKVPDKLLKGYNVVRLDKAGIIELMKECVDPAEERFGDDSYESWVTSFWSAQLDLGGEQISRLPLIPTLSPLHFISLSRIQDASVVVVDEDRTMDFDYGVLQRLKMTVVVRARLSEVAAGLVGRKKPAAYQSLLEHMEKNQSECLEAINRLSPKDREALGHWARSRIRYTPKNLVTVACRLPVWPVRHGPNFASLDAVTILPRSMPSEILRLFTEGDVVDWDDGMQRVNKKPCTAMDITWLLRDSPGNFPVAPGTLLRQTKRTVYRRFIEHFLSFGKVDGYSLLVPNERWVLTEVETLFERHDLFQAAFQDTRLLSESYQDLAESLECHGLNRRRRLDLAMFIECAKAFSPEENDSDDEDDDEEPNKHDQSKILYRYFNSLSLKHQRDSNRCQELNSLKFIPRDASNRPGYDGIKLDKYMRPKILSPSKIALPEYEAICWSQRGRPDPEPNPTLCGTYQNLGKPTGTEVVKHLKALVSIGKKYGRRPALLSDLKATYKWLNEHVDDISVEIRNENSSAIFLNVNDPDSDNWKWHSANNIIDGIQDIEDLHDVKSFLRSYSDLLRAAGVRAESKPDDYKPVVEDKTVYYRSRFNDMRQRGYDVNVTFTAKDKEWKILPAHRNWLSLQSNHFWTSLVTGDFQESRPLGCGEHVNIAVVDYSSLCVKEVVDWIYIGKLSDSVAGQSNNDDENLRTKLDLALEMLSLAHYWEVTELHERLQELIIKFINPHWVKAIREHAQTTCATHLLKACDQYVKRNGDIMEELGVKD